MTYTETTVLMQHVPCGYLKICVVYVYVCECWESSPWVQGQDRELLHRHTEQQSSVKKQKETQINYTD